jgi:hypothetical protein
VPVGGAVAGHIVLIKAGYDARHAATAPRDIEREPKLCHCLSTSSDSLSTWHKSDLKPA